MYEPKYFSKTEFLMATPSCKLEDMDENFLRKLDHLRELCGFPLVVNCFYRSVEWDKSKGRSGTSYHCKGRAADIRCTSSARRSAIVLKSTICGLNGVGIYKNFIHVDDRDLATMWVGQ